MINITDYLKMQGDRVEEKLAQLIPVRQGPYSQLFEAARYSLLAGGKRLRPIMTLATVEMLGANPLVALTAASTLEMVHTYSLIHDDLPCMDNDDFRRGKPTLHRQYSEGHAVLTGDYLLTYAFEVLATDPLLSADKKIKLISILAKRSGAEGMIGGQTMDLASEGKKISLDTLKLLHRNKTGALLTAALEFGGVIAEATPQHMDYLRQFGENIGLAFQIIDDILDVTSSEAKHGRTTASDVINNKSTYVTLLGIEQSQAYAQDCYQKAVRALKQLPVNPILLVNLADFIIKRKH